MCRTTSSLPLAEDSKAGAESRAYHRLTRGLAPRCVWESWDQQEPAYRGAAAHVGAGACGFGKRVDAADPDLQLTPVIQLNSCFARARSSAGLWM